MAPKKAKGKGRKQDDDELWSKDDGSASTKIPALLADPDIDNEPPLRSKKGGGGLMSGFAGLSIEETLPADENEDFGGLMSAIKSNTAKTSKKEKKKKKRWDEEEDDTPSTRFEDGPPPGHGSDAEAAAAKGDITAPKAAQEMTAEELADLEFGPTKDKKGKNKKDKGKKQQNADEIVEEPSTAVSLAPVLTEPAKAEDEDGEGGSKILSKKEKERLKKEKDKEKKKQEADAKKKLDQGSTPATPAEGADAEANAANAKLSKNQRKKLKEAFGGAEELKAAEAKIEASSKKGPSGKVAALKAAQEAQRLAREKAEREAEEERIRLEEEERRKEAEAKRIEDEKIAKKEREKAKREQLKKEGKLLTPKQKKERAAAEMRRQALLASGAIADTQQQPDREAAPSTFRYGARQPRGGRANAGQGSQRTESPVPPDTASVRDTSTVRTESPRPEVKDSWENDDEVQPPPAALSVKDDWDASSDEEPVKPEPAPAPVTKPPAKNDPPAKPPTSDQPQTKLASKGKPVATPIGTSHGAKQQEESSESGSSSESESESDSDDSDSNEDSSSDEELTAAQRDVERRKAEAAARKAKRIEEAMAARSKDDLRSPICCILGHVDTGKTKLLDKIRQTNVQEGEAGGITQQIGATYFPVDAIREKTAVLAESNLAEYKIPGLLVIDTPGHESFTNLRSRGSSLCNIAVLVVDIMHGLEPQTLESLRMLRDRKTPFIVALNKIDRMYGWEVTPNNGFRDSYAKQKPGVKKEFEKRTKDTILAFAEQGLNAKLYYENDNLGRNVSLVPTSAVTGEGVPDMIMLLVSLTQQRMTDKLMYLSEIECTVLEVKVIEGLGTTIDVILSNGILREGDKIVLCGLNGPIVTQIRALLTPQPLRELRIKSSYVHHKEVKAALGVKITAPDLEKAIAGSRLLVCTPDDDEDDLREEVMSDLTSLLNFIDKSGRGVCVQASTLGSLEALLDFLKSSKIPVSGINIGPVHKKDIMRASTMLEKAKELACILCFDVTVDKDAESLAKEMGIRLFKADIIYHLFDAFTAYNNEITEAKRRDAAPQAVWPCRLKIIACFAKRDPIILGVDIIDGSLRIGTPLCVVKTDATTGKKDIIHLGKITSLEINHKTMEIVKKSQAGAGVAVKIEHAVYESAKMYGRHFDDKDEVISQITRASIDVLKESFRSDVSQEEWLLIKGLKPRLGIP